MLSAARPGARTFWPRQILDRFRPLPKPSGPALEHLCHAAGLNAELRHRHSAVDGFAVLGDQAVADNKAAHAVDHHALSYELRDLRGEARQRPRISFFAVENGIEHFPTIGGCVAVKQILHHVRDFGAALMRTVDVVVINGVLDKTASKARAVAGFR